MAGTGIYLAGAVRVEMLFEPADPARVVGASVKFGPGARTAWHTHPLGQTLIVTYGRGWAQRCGPVEKIRPGDVAWFAPGKAEERAKRTSEVLALSTRSGQSGSVLFVPKSRALSFVILNSIAGREKRDSNGAPAALRNVPISPRTCTRVSFMAGVLR